MRKSVQLRSSAKHPVLATELRPSNGGDRYVGANGELNASSKKDLFEQQRRFLSAANNGNMLQIDSATSRELV